MLDGVTVLDLASVGPAARATRILADYGADVVKIGPVSKAAGKQIRPPFFSYGAGRGLRRVQIDLKAPEGRDALLALAAKADVFVESFRPGVVDRLGIGWDAVRAANPRIVYCSTSGYGQTGPYAQWAGHDLNYLALGGFLACSTPRGDGGPPIPGATVADSAAGGMHAAIAILAALHARETTGEGAWLDVAVADGVLQLMSLHVDEHLATGARPGPGSNLLTGRLACYDVYECADGKWLSVAAIEPAFWANLCRALGCERWLEHQHDDAVQDAIRADFAAAFRRRGRDAWVAELAPADTCVAPVYDVAELVDDPHFVARGAFAEAKDAGHGTFRQTGAVLAGAARDLPVHEVAAPDQTDTDAVLREAGVPDATIRRLRDAGVVE
ncbi:MAG TPA: CaiB/BaiF CoA-transferase family protein [Myxococcota bacterium]|nr:CaiB/BaiF CoA-transferase family protein [Myxococcota bacterium]